MAVINGNNSNNTLNGTSSDDTINGLGGNDTINGFAGNDSIVGGAGNDSLDGGDGSDTYVVGPGDGIDIYHDTGLTGYDRIVAGGINVVIGLKTGFGSVSGVEEINANGYTQVTIGGSNTADTFDFSSTLLTGIVAIDAGGGADNITGSSGSDAIIGGGGNDTLNGGEGADTYLVGLGDGTDTYTDTGGSGTDRILAVADNVQIGLKTGFGPANGIEEISADGHAGISIAGSGGTDAFDFSATLLTGIVLIDAGGGADTIVGSTGNDSILGGAGNDSLNGGEGSDTYFVGGSDGDDTYADTGGSGADRILAIANNVAIGLKSGFGVASGIEEISANGHTGISIGGSGNPDTFDFSATLLTGIVSIDAGGGADTIMGSNGNDSIDGNGGNDILDGGKGNDTLTGGVGTDLFITTNLAGEGGDDVIVDFVPAVDNIRVNSALFSSVANLLAGATQVGPDVVFDLGGGASLTLKNISVGTLNPAHFEVNDIGAFIPAVTVNDATGDEDTAIPLSISAGLQDTDGSETLALLLEDLPVGATLSDGTNNFTTTSGSTTANITAWTLTSLTIKPPVNSDADFTLTVRAIATEASNGDTAETTQSLNVTVNAIDDAPTTSPVTLAAIAEDSGARLITQAELLANASDIDGPSLTATNLAIASGSGTLFDNGNGTWNYTPTLNDDSSVSFSYTVTDGSLSAAGSATLDITPVNDAPTTTPVTLAAIAEDSGARLITQAELLANASDIDGPSLTATGLAIASGSGSLINNGNGTWNYTSALNDDSSVSFSYTVTDGSLSAAGSATLDITPVNDAPTTTPVTLAAIAEDSGARLITQAELLANASDVDGPSLTATGLAIASGSGSLINNGNGTWSYTPALNDDSSVSFSYTVTDGSLSAAGSATLDITSVNDAPTTTPVTLAAIAEDSGARLITQAELLANASDIDGPSLTATGLAIASGSGSLINNGNGTWSYTPASNDDSSVSFSYTVTDGALSAAGSASLDITPVNDAPDAEDVAADADENSGSGAPGNSDSYNLALSADGRYVAFTSDATNLVLDDSNGTSDVFVKDMLTGMIALVSVEASGAQGNGPSGGSAISADGRYVAFASAAGLGTSDTNGFYDIFVKDTQTGAIVRVSTDGSGAAANGSSIQLAISADGRYVAFSSDASNLVGGDTNGAADVFVKDTQTGAITRVSTGASGVQGNGGSYEPTISADGQHVAFISYASNLVGGDPNGTGGDIFIKDILTGAISRVSTGGSGAPPAQFSADGTKIVFSSPENDLVAGDSNGFEDIFVKDIQTGAVTRVSTNASGVSGNDVSTSPAISADGRYVAFKSTASDLVANDTNSVADIFVKDTLTGAVLRVSTDASGAEGDSASATNNRAISISADGRYVAFESSASNLVPDDTNGTLDIFMKDTLTGAISLVSADTSPILVAAAFSDVDASDSHSFSVDDTDTIGLVIDNGDGTFSYNPNGQYEYLAFGETATDSFDYTVDDGYGGTDTATVTVTIHGANDAPTTTPVTLAAIAEDSGARLITQPELLANASDVDGPSLTATGLAIASGSGTLFDNGNGTWNYTPALNDDSAVSFSYTVTDGSLSAAGSATLDITPVNDAPTTTPVTLAAIAEDSGARLITQPELLANASDVDGPSLTATGLAIASGSGTLFDNGNGTWNYTPALNDDSAVSFSYTVTDGSLSAAGSATLDITPVNDAPTTTPVTLAAIAEDSGARLITQAELLANASDVDGPALTATGLTIASGSGSLFDNGNGTWNYTPALNDDSAVSFSYTVTDGSLSTAGSAMLDITPVNDAPTTSPVTLAVIAEDSGARLITQAELLANASDVDGPSLTATGLAIASGSGSLFDNGNGTWNYTPALNDDSSVSFSYTVTDGSLSAAGSATLDITPVNDAPVLDLDANNSTTAGSNYITTFTRNGSPVAVVDSDVSIADVDDTNIESATITITDAQANDSLSVSNLAALTALGIAVGSSDATHITLTGSASKANYQSALKLITFSNASTHPGTVDRHVTVVVNDGDVNSNTATATIHVTNNIDLTSLSAAQGFIIQGDTAGDQAGRSVSSAGDVNGDGFADVIIGAYRGDDGGTDAGEAYVVFGKSSGFGAAVGGRQVIDLTTLSAADGFIIQGDVAGEQAGISVSSAGDVNGDGFDDLIVGVPDGDDGGSNAGEAYVVFGKSGGFGTNVGGRQVIDLTTLSAADGFIIQGDVANDLTGWSVSSAGDVNGDGFDDLIVGALSGDDGGFDAGEAYVVFGKSGGFGTPVGGRQVIDLTTLSAADGFIVQGDAAYDWAGISVSAAGDVNGDGFDDLIVGARNGDDGGSDAGEAYVVFGKSSGFGAAVGGRQVIDLTTLSAVDGFIIQGDVAGDQAGISVSTAGDVNGDGFGDLIVGAPDGDDGGSIAGEAYVVFGKSGGFGTNVGGRQVIDLTTLSPADGFIVQGDVVGDEAGFSVSSAGDVNGDGFADLIVGAPGGDDGGTYAGEAYVVFGKIGGFGTAVGGRQVIDLTTFSAADGFIVQGDVTGDFNGWSVSSAGDVNGDGFDDLVVGAPRGDDGGSDAGESYLIFGGDFLGNVMFAGTTGADTLTGTAAAEVFVGGQGNDMLIGNGGADAFQGGAGNDSIVVGSAIPLDLNGGSGIDTVNLDSTGASIDLSGLNSSRFTDIEKIDLTGTQANTLVLDKQAVLDMAGTNGDNFDNNTLLIKGDTGDHVTILDGWTQGAALTNPWGETGSFVSYTNGAAQLLIETDVIVKSSNDIDLATLTLAQGFHVFGADAGDREGFSVSSAGDVNGDGFDDLIIGAYRGRAYSNAKPSAGESYVIFGKATGFADLDLATLTPAQGFRIFGADVFDLSGASVSSGDINGDGFDDLMIGAYLADGPGNARSVSGEVAVIFGKGSGLADIDLASLTPVQGFHIFGADATDYLGKSGLSAADVNGDGFDDLILGTRYGDGPGNSSAQSGESYVIFGNSSGFSDIDLSALAPAQGFTIFGADMFDRSGLSVSSAGDVNGDGFDDVIVGAPVAAAFGNAKPFAGESYVIFGKSSGFANIDLETLTPAQGFRIYGAEADDISGASVSSAGDVNGDGLDDLIVGAPRGDTPGNAKGDAGEIYVIFGQSSGLSDIDLAAFTPAQGFTIFGADAGDLSGSPLASAGDVNGDGFDDVLIGVARGDAYSNAKYNAGETYVLFGKASGFANIDLASLSATDGFRIFGADAFDVSGGSVSSAGDVNGDGFDDLIIGASRASAAGNAKTEAGESYVIFGGDFLGNVMFAGTAAADTLTGTAATETFVGGQGNDVLIGNGGADAFQGGAGNDSITASDFLFAKVDGGSGNDKLVLLGSEDSFDFTTLADNKTQSIEAIDFSGSGNNILTLELTDVLNLPDGRNFDFTGVATVPKSIVIDGDTGDTLQLVGDPRGTWTQTASDMNLAGTGSGAYDFWVFDAGAADFAALAVHHDVGVFLL